MNYIYIEKKVVSFNDDFFHYFMIDLAKIVVAAISSGLWLCSHVVSPLNLNVIDCEQ